MIQIGQNNLNAINVKIHISQSKKGTSSGKRSMAGEMEDSGSVRGRKKGPRARSQVKGNRVTGNSMAGKEAQGQSLTDPKLGGTVAKPEAGASKTQGKSSKLMAGSSGQSSKSKAAPSVVKSQVKTATVTSGQVMAGISSLVSPVVFQEDVRSMPTV